jgi:general secretion pathway protein K
MTASQRNFGRPSTREVASPEPNARTTMQAATPCDLRPRTTRDGFIIVAILWILGALSALVSIYAVYVVNTAAGFVEHDDRIREEALVSAALEVTAYRQLTAQPQSRPSRGDFIFNFAGVDIQVSFCSEAARIDLNAAPKQVLAGLFAILGARPADADNYADRVVDWRTVAPKDQPLDGPSYGRARPTFGPRGAKFPHVDELVAVNNLPPALVERTLPFVTVYSGRPQINVSDAAPQVIAALPGMTADRVKAVLEQREAEPDNKQALMRLLGTAQQYATTDASRAIRVNVRFARKSARQRLYEVVFLLFDEGTEPYSVMSWRNVLDTERKNQAGLR